MTPTTSRNLLILALLAILAVVIPAGLIMAIMVWLMQALPSWPIYGTLVFLLGVGGAIATGNLLRRWGPGLRERLQKEERIKTLLQLASMSAMLTLGLVGFATLVPVLVELLTLLTDR